MPPERTQRRQYRRYYHPRSSYVESVTELFAFCRTWVDTIYPGLKPVHIALTLDSGAEVRLPVPDVPGLPESTPETADTFVPSRLQQRVLEALDGRALRGPQIREAVRSTSILSRHPGGIRELKWYGLVKHDRRFGFYRPDRPPPELGGTPPAPTAEAPAPPEPLPEPRESASAKAGAVVPPAEEAPSQAVGVSPVAPEETSPPG